MDEMEVTILGVSGANQGTPGNCKMDPWAGPQNRPPLCHPPIIWISKGPISIGLIYLTAMLACTSHLIKTRLNPQIDTFQCMFVYPGDFHYDNTINF